MDRDHEAAGTKTGPVKLHWVVRTLILTIPLHVAVFLGLYLAISGLVETEVVRAHERDSETLLLVALSDLHVTMPRGEEVDVHQRLWSLIDSHERMNLHLFSAAGDTIAGRCPEGVSEEDEQAEVQALLRSEQEERFWLQETPDDQFVRGLVKIRGTPTCEPCHEVGVLRGVASMTLDLTAQLRSVRFRLWLFLGAAVVVWGVAAVLFNRLRVGTVRRSAAHLRADLDAIGSGDASDAGPAVRILDPMSAAVFESLRRSLEQQREREERFASRMLQADRLASLGKLAAGLAHEIKNPLAGIQGVLEILRDEAPEDGNRGLYEQMLAELGRVDTTIRALLSFARPAPPQPVPTEVRSLLEEILKLLQPGLQRRRIRLELETAPVLGRFALDPEKIRQVLVNLITNASEALAEDPDREGGRIVVRATVFPDRRGIVVAVADDGPGIAEENQKKIFQPFFTTRFAGTGLGLAVAEGLVAQHGGTIEIESEPGRGSTFFVVLPEPGAATREGEQPSPGRETLTEPWP